MVEWITKKIEMLENVRISDEIVVHVDLGKNSLDQDSDNTVGYQLCEDLDWTFAGVEVEYTYVIDLDNYVFTVNGKTHLKLDDMPPSNPGLGGYFGGTVAFKIPSQHLNTTVDLWPAPSFNIEECQKQYETLNPIVTPAAEWGAPTWDDLSLSQCFSIDLTHHLISKTARAREMAFAYTPKIRDKVGHFCWDVLCSATTSVPVSCYNTQIRSRGTDRSLSGGRGRSKPFGIFSVLGMWEGISRERFYLGANGRYCWVRGCLIGFCIRLGEEAYVAHEVELMVQKMRHDGHAECVGIIISSQQEMIAVAVDDGLQPTRKVRHTPVLDLRPNADKPGQASDGLMLLIHLLGPPLTVPQLPWRIPQPSQSPLMWSRSKLPFEVLQHIIRYSKTVDYLSLCRVSKFVRSACLANPRFGSYTILYKLPQHELTYVARYTDEDTPLILNFYWYSPSLDGTRWKARVRSLQDLQGLNNKRNVDGDS
ncbi:hypothetical protein OPQ81_003382 [Rhizoctonia solani]|nr:hypothetical protein OPQ81_003382 [Rhizoctonia solani]